MNTNELIKILILVLGILITVVILTIILIKSKRTISGTVKHGNSEATIEIKRDKKANKSNKTQSNKIQQNEIINPDDFDLDKLSLHRFFTTILCQYTTDNSVFPLYNETLRLNIIKDVDEISQFKIMLASKYLHLCLFKVLGELVRKWITSIVEEIGTTKNFNKIPATFYAISQYITQYKNDAYREGKQIEFKWQDKTFYGIPTKFMTRFNNWSDSNMNRVYNMISDVLYSTQNNWFAKSIELLDLFEVIFIMLHDQMDSTLIILNGEITQFLNSIKNENII
jgi:hypothetical protein